MRSLIGSMVDKYRIAHLIGVGGMGEVYLAEDLTTNRQVAIKFLRNGSDDASWRQRFKNEARIQAKLYHPHIATLFDFIPTPEGPCLIMEYVDGIMLSDYIAKQGILDCTQAIDIFRKIIQAVAYLHANGVVHRDIKPQNVKIGANGVVKLLDFGIARDMDSPKLTRIGSAIGSWPYLAPEQLLHNRPADKRSDVWALGLLGYEMFVGKPLIEEQTFTEILKFHANFQMDSYKLPGHLPSQVKNLIARCLAREPRQRFQNAGEMMAFMESRVGSEITTSNHRLHSLDLYSRWSTLFGGLKRYWGIAALLGSFLLLSVASFRVFDSSEREIQPRVDKLFRQAMATAKVRIECASHCDIYRGGELVRRGTTGEYLEEAVGSALHLTIKRNGEVIADENVIVKSYTYENTYQY